MAEGQKKRQIGKGMKARGTKRVKPQKEVKEVTEQSTTEGQQIPVPEAVLEVQEGNETPGNLEPENGENSFQNLENSEAIVAHDEGLEAALKESAGEQPQLQQAVIDGKEYFIGVDLASGDEKVEMAGVDLETAMAVGTGTVKELQPLRPAQAEVLGKAMRRVADESSTGPQPDGSEKFIIKVEEGYVEAVKQWAESDGIPVENWLSNALYSYISTYGEPAKGR